jgi:hypothetical protein
VKRINNTTTCLTSRDKLRQIVVNKEEDSINHLKKNTLKSKFSKIFKQETGCIVNIHAIFECDYLEYSNNMGQKTKKNNICTKFNALPILMITIFALKSTFNEIEAKNWSRNGYFDVEDEAHIGRVGTFKRFTNSRLYLISSQQTKFF